MFGTAVFEEFSLWGFHHGDLKLVFCSPQTGTQMGPLLKKILAPTRARLVVAFWIWPTGPWAALLGASFFPLPVTWPQGPLGYKAGAWCGICPRAGWCVSILSKKNFGSLGCECWLIFCWCPPPKKSKFGSCSIYSTHSWVPWGHGVHAGVRLPEGKPHDFP